MKWLLALACLALPWSASADQIMLNGKHNLSVTGPGKLKAQSERRICVFCHVPHGAPGGNNRPATSASAGRAAVSSRANDPRAGGPNGASRTCLSCHDGTIAVGQTLAAGNIAMRGTPDGKIETGSARIDDLSSSHPVSFRLISSTRDRVPPAGDRVKLDHNGMVQCTSCHDPHSEENVPGEKKFLVKSSRSSALCESCHQLPWWRTNPAAHQSSFASLVAVTGPLAELGYSTVSDASCAACHQSHGANGARLVRNERGASDDRPCLQCHNGRVATTDLLAEMSKPYAHTLLAAGPSGHDADEGPRQATHSIPELYPATVRHVVCVDCHEPHSAWHQTTSAPRAAGSLAGVWGIDRNGLRIEPVNFEYEICFKCHADSANQPQARGPTLPETVRRAVTDVNLRRVFDLTAVSFHPVEGPGRSPTVPSLIAPLSAASIIYCSDCHGSDSGRGAPRGPHGSSYPHLLAANYSTLDHTPESPAAYALCYKCHSRDILLSSRSSFPLHRKHVMDQAAPCSACHNAHGVSTVAGSRIANAHLIDFDVTVVQPSRAGLRQYRTGGGSNGNCTLTCHGSEHQNRSYP